MTVSGQHETDCLEASATCAKFDSYLLYPIVYSSIGDFLAPLSALIVKSFRDQVQSGRHFECSKLLKVALAGQRDVMGSQWKAMRGQWEVSGRSVGGHGRSVGGHVVS